jgi:hypothetical protein
MFMHNARLRKVLGHIHDPLNTSGLRNPRLITAAFSFSGDAAFFEQNIRVQSTGDPLGCVGDLGW